jgi:hypothetical protein
VDVAEHDSGEAVGGQRRERVAEGGLEARPGGRVLA